MSAVAVRSPVLTEKALSDALEGSPWLSVLVVGDRAKLVAQRILEGRDAKGRPGPLFGAVKLHVDPYRDPDDWELF